LQGEELENLLSVDQKYTLIMYSLPIDPRSLALVQEYSRQQKIPLVALHSAGFYSYFRIILPGSFPIVDTHPDSTATTDLRLLNPWPELSDFAARLTDNIENLSALEHGHIPYVVLLLHYLKRWKESHGNYPATYQDKKAFREFVSAGARTDNPEGGEENFDEAVAAVLKTVTVPSIPSSVKVVFDHKPDDVSTCYYFLIDALLTLVVKS
jgi:amyloid beta precursor protein binding protein 1